MKAQLYTAPVIEPISLAELKMQIRADSGTFDDNLTITQSLAYGSKAIQNNYTVHVGTGVDVLGKQAEVLLHCGTNGAGGTNDTKIQESDDNVTYTDYTGGAFTQITTDGAGATEPDNVDYKKPYTGAKQYIRTASKVLVAACEFGTSILLNEAETAEDDKLNRDIRAARRHIENTTRRKLLTQTWDYYLDAWPSGDYIKLPFGNLQTVTSVSWKDTDGTETTLTLTTDYLVETNGEECGRIVLPYGESWPSGTLYPSNPIKIRFICGWTTAALIPDEIKAAMFLFCGDLYSNREAQSVGQAQIYFKNSRYDELLASARIWDEF